MASVKSQFPKVSIITINYFGIEDTLSCLKNLEKCTYPNFEVLVFDNGSGDTQVEILKKYTTSHDHVRFIDNKINLGFAAGNNVGIDLVLKENKSQYIYFLNNDTEVEPDFLDTAVAALEKRPTYGIAASLSMQYLKPALVENAGHTFLDCGDVIPRGRHKPKSSFQKEEDTLGACSAGALYRVQTLKEIGGYDEEFFLNYEDVDLSLRSILYGWKCVLIPSSVIYHKVNASISKVRNFAFMLKSQENQLKAYIYTTPFFVILLNTPSLLLRDLGVTLINIIFFKWKILRMFWTAKINVLKNISEILRRRSRNMKHKNISSWYIWSLQKWFISTYITYFYEIIITGRRSVLEDK